MTSTEQSSSVPAPTVSTVAPRPPIRRVRGLDGMRALAAMVVLAYHLVPGQMRGGFLGVDIFFVLSGFLITALLVREHDASGQINLRSFWLRRIRRLLPAVALMAIVTLIVAGLIDVNILAGILPQFLGVITFAYNWVEIAIGASYFDYASPHLWTNVWSLAVEQQFYLVWPVIVLGIVALAKKYRWIVPASLAAASAGLMTWLIAGADDYTRAYQGTDSHAFGLMLGAVLALVATRPLQTPVEDPSRITVWLRGLLAWIGFAVVVAGWFLIPDNEPWVYPWGTLIVCIGMLAVMQGFLSSIDTQLGPGQLLASILDNRVFVWLGERSYGIYLWHWPVLVIMNSQFPRMPVEYVAAIVGAISVIAAHLSYTFVETPMRFNGITPTLRSWLGPSWHIIDPSKMGVRKPAARDYVRLVAPALAVIVTVGTAIGMLLSAPEQTTAELAVQRGQEHVALSAQASEDAEPGAEPVPDIAPTPSEEPTPGPTVPPTGDNVSVIGDSVALASAPALEEQLPGIAIDAEVSRSIVAGLSLIQQQLDAGTLRPYVVLSLAANSEMSVGQIDEVISLVGPERRLVLITGYGPQRLSWIWASNESIHVAAQAHKDVVEVADWATAIADHPEHLASDYVHPDAVGGSIFAGLVVDALARF